MKRFISVIMALLMCFTAVAIGINSTVANAADPSASNFLLSNPAPAGLDSTDNPYGQPVDRPFSLSTMNELFYYQSWDGSYEQYKFDLFTGRDPNLGLDYSSACKENDGSDVWLKDPNRYNSSNPDDAKVEFDEDQYKECLPIFRTQLKATKRMSKESALLFSEYMQQRIREEIAACGIPVERMTNEERAAIVRRLEQLEVFYMKDSVKTTAELLGISVPTVYRLMKRGGAPAAGER